MFFDKSCNIKQTNYTKVGGVSKRSYTTIYSGIECNFELRKTQGASDINLARNSDELEYIVVLPISYKLVRENYVIELIDPVLGNRGDFIIKQVQADQSIGGDVDCITLYANELKGQL